METIYIVILISCVVIFGMIGMIIKIVSGIRSGIRSIEKQGACYTSDGASRGCANFVDEKNCSGKHFNTMDECNKYMNQPTNKLSPGYCIVGDGIIDPKCVEKSKDDCKIVFEGGSATFWYPTMKECDENRQRLQEQINDNRNRGKMLYACDRTDFKCKKVELGDPSAIAHAMPDCDAMCTKLKTHPMYPDDGYVIRKPTRLITQDEMTKCVDANYIIVDINECPGYANNNNNVQ